MYWCTCNFILVSKLLKVTSDMLSHDGVKIEIVPLNKDHEVDNPECVKFIEQFVKDVRDFSSQYGSNTSISYTAYNITGNPSKFPDYGDFPQAFVMVNIKYLQSIKLLNILIQRINFQYSF